MKNQKKGKIDMNNMNQRSGNCQTPCNQMPSGCMRERQGRGCMNNGNSGCRRQSSMPMPTPCNPCDCKDNSSAQNYPLLGMAVGIGYVPWQQWECVYNVEEGLARGTIFPSLDLPFYGCIPRGYFCNKGGRA